MQRVSGVPLAPLFCCTGRVRPLQFYLTQTQCLDKRLTLRSGSLAGNNCRAGPLGLQPLCRNATQVFQGNAENTLPEMLTLGVGSAEQVNSAHGNCHRPGSPTPGTEVGVTGSADRI